jgi:hypothetical protein
LGEHYVREGERDLVETNLDYRYVKQFRDSDVVTVTATVGLNNTIESRWISRFAKTTVNIIYGLAPLRKFFEDSCETGLPKIIVPFKLKGDFWLIWQAGIGSTTGALQNRHIQPKRTPIPTTCRSACYSRNSFYDTPGESIIIPNQF